MTTATASARAADASSDAVLAARLAAGDDRALAIAYDRHGALVHGLARRVLRDGRAAQDVTQEVFVHLWEHPDRYDPARSALRSYLCMLAHRRAVDRVRREESVARRAERAARCEPSVVADAADAVVEDLDTAELARRTREAVAALPEDQRRCVQLAYYEGLSYREVAVALGIPEGTAKSRLRLALAKLTAALDPQEVRGARA